jgi:hypothetical protein
MILGCLQVLDKVDEDAVHVKPNVQTMGFLGVLLCFLVCTVGVVTEACAEKS